MNRGRTIASSTSWMPRSLRRRVLNESNLRQRRCVRIFRIRACMIHLLVENCYGLERIARAAVRIVATSSVDHDVVNVFRHKIAITGDFRLQKELTKAIEGHGVSALIVL